MRLRSAIGIAIEVQSTVCVVHSGPRDLRPRRLATVRAPSPPHGVAGRTRLPIPRQSAIGFLRERLALRWEVDEETIELAYEEMQEGSGSRIGWSLRSASISGLATCVSDDSSGGTLSD